MLRGEVTCPQSANSNLSLSDLVAQPSAEALKEQGWETRVRLKTFPQVCSVDSISLLAALILWRVRLFLMSCWQLFCDVYLYMRAYSMSTKR